MLPKELFSLLTIDGIEFNGDVELTEIGVLWSLTFEAPQLSEDEAPLIAEEELVEAFEEDLEIIYALLDEYDEDLNEFEVGEIQIDGDFAFVDLIVVDLDFIGE